MHHGDPSCLRGVVRLLLICDLVQERMQFVVDCLDLVCPIFRRRQDWLIRCSEEGVSFCLHRFGRGNLSRSLINNPHLCCFFWQIRCCCCCFCCHGNDHGYFLVRFRHRLHDRDNNTPVLVICVLPTYLILGHFVDPDLC